jgi:hypothetical protein
VILDDGTTVELDDDPPRDSWSRSPMQGDISVGNLDGGFSPLVDADDEMMDGQYEVDPAIRSTKKRPGDHDHVNIPLYLISRIDRLTPRSSKKVSDDRPGKHARGDSEDGQRDQSVELQPGSDLLVPASPGGSQAGPSSGIPSFATASNGDVAAYLAAHFQSSHGPSPTAQQHQQTGGAAAMATFGSFPVVHKAISETLERQGAPKDISVIKANTRPNHVIGPFMIMTAPEGGPPTVLGPVDPSLLPSNHSVACYYVVYEKDSRRNKKPGKIATMAEEGQMPEHHHQHHQHNQEPLTPEQRKVQKTKKGGRLGAFSPDVMADVSFRAFSLLCVHLGH